MSDEERSSLVYEKIIKILLQLIATLNNNLVKTQKLWTRNTFQIKSKLNKHFITYTK